MTTGGWNGAQYTRIELAPIILIKGEEGVRIDRALSAIRHQVRKTDPQYESSELVAADYTLGNFDVLTSPSLFGESKLILVRDGALMNEDFIKDVLAYIEAPVLEKVWIVICHPGGNVRGKKVCDAIAKAGFPVIPADLLEKDRDKLALVREDLRSARRRMDADAMQAIVDALGSDLRAMACAVAQLLVDVEGTIRLEDVHRYYAGRIEATGFDITDAAIAGQTARALTLLRHALATGVAPLAIVGAFAMKFRTLAKVSSGSRAVIAKMPSWQVDRARRELRGWHDHALAEAINAIALADEEAKGGSEDREGAIEKAVITICHLRNGHSLSRVS